jgi:hypothetical protein
MIIAQIIKTSKTNPVKGFGAIGSIYNTVKILYNINSYEI